MSTRKPKVIVVGGTYIDMAFRCTEIPSPGQAVVGSSLRCVVSGEGPNQAAEAALCGCDVYLISKVGDDPYGKFTKESLAEYNINTDFIYTANAKNTGIITTMVNGEGENAMCIYRGANNSLMQDDIETAETAIAEADICLIHGRLPSETVAAAIRLAKVQGTAVILNPARYIRRSGDEDMDLPIDYLSVDVLVANLYEAAQITEHSEANIRSAKMVGSEIVARGIHTAVITMGRRGCMVVDRNSADHIPAFEIELLDDAARGDAFAGALASYLAVKKDIRDAVKFASAAGAIACTKFGSIESMPTKAEIIEMLQKDETA